MCGFVGFSGRGNEALLQRMTDAVAHRGPDDQGLWLRDGGRVGLGHRRLSIIDVSCLGHQPMSDQEGRVTIAFNGEIFNYRELRATLEAEGHDFRSTSDTEVLLHLYLARREGMLPMLNGMFAFALWDEKERALLLARDGVGVKPLYYSEGPDGVIFGSEIKALLEDPSVPRDIDLTAVKDYLTYLWCPAPGTLLRAVRKALPGEALWVRDGRVEKRWNFYRLPVAADQPEANLEETIAELDHQLEAAVQRQLIADVPVGAFLSGGLDSSAVVAYARKHYRAPLQCFAIGFQGSDYEAEGFANDIPYAREIAKHLGVNLNVLYTDASMAQHLGDMVYYLDEPQADFAPLYVQLIAREARKMGIKVLLSGAGGDDVFGGYRRHLALQLERYWSWLPLSLRKSAASGSRMVPVGHAFGRRFSKAMRYAHLDGDERLASYFRWVSEGSVESLFTAEARREISSRDPLVESLRDIPASADPLAKMLFLEQRFFVPDHNLNYTDKLSMAEGIEVRVPLLDIELIRFASTIPVKWKQKGSEGKWIFKKTMEKHLPRHVIYRPKTGFGAPLRTWLRTDLRPMLEDLLSEEAVRRRGIFEPAVVRALVADEVSGRADASYLLLSLMCIELWFRKFIDERAPVAASANFGLRAWS
jgi:asparagine synthase (glutamine-hydrolysing)